MVKVSPKYQVVIPQKAVRLLRSFAHKEKPEVLRAKAFLRLPAKLIRSDCLLVVIRRFVRSSIHAACRRSKTLRALVTCFLLSGANLPHCHRRFTLRTARSHSTCARRHAARRGPVISCTISTDGQTHARPDVGVSTFAALRVWLQRSRNPGRRAQSPRHPRRGRGPGAPSATRRGRTGIPVPLRTSEGGSGLGASSFRLKVGW